MNAICIVQVNAFPEGHNRRFWLKASTGSFIPPEQEVPQGGAVRARNKCQPCSQGGTLNVRPMTAEPSEALVGLIQEAIVEVGEGKYPTGEQAMKAFEDKADKVLDQ